jgi:hypothetical protein
MIRKSLQPRTRQPAKGRAKVPLTYYRSAGGAAQDDKSPFIRSKPKTRVRKYLLGALDFGVLLLFLAIFIYSLIIRPEPKIAANSYTYHPAATYQQAAQEQLKSLTSRNKLTINEDQIIKNLQSEFPEIANARLELPVISQIPTLHLTIAEPALVLKNNKSSYIVSSIGTVVDKAEGFSRSKELPSVEDQADFDLKPGSPAFSRESTSFIVDVWRYTKASNINVASMVLPVRPMELNLKTTDKPYFVKFYLGGDAVLQTGQFVAARNQFEKDGVNPSEYLDVRIQGKIFYK